MPGPVSDSNPGPGPDSPYVPSWCYANNARVDSIYRRGVLSCACDKFRTKEPLAIFEREHPYALPLSWLKRINPPAVREAVERGEEIVA